MAGEGVPRRHGQSLRRFFEGSPISSLRREMDDLLENFFGEGRLTDLPAEGTPRLDLSETAEVIQVVTDMPGFDAGNIHIELNDNQLSIRGERTESQQSDDPDRKFHRVERFTGSVARSVWLPRPVQEDQIAAELKDGVLTITLPKKEEAKTRRVEVRRG